MQKINPTTLIPPFDGMFSHIVLPPVGSQLAFITGQGAFDVDGRLVGDGDYRKQSEQCFRNVRDALAAIGAGPEHIVKMVLYVADCRPELREEVNAGGQDVFGENWPVTATTLLGVQSFGVKGLLVEVEVIAALPVSS
jgi:enamine deaminase RidA (YjgF/YER057c/UK114 family)